MSKKCTCDPLDLGPLGHLRGCPLNPSTDALAIVEADAEWPYSTMDEVSHLAITDVGVLRARIDMLLEERREFRKAQQVELSSLVQEETLRSWGLTPMEIRFTYALLQSKGVVTREQLHVSLSVSDEPDTNIKMVDVIVCRLRKKFGALVPEGVPTIQTVWGKGHIAAPALRALTGVNQPTAR